MDTPKRTIDDATQAEWTEAQRKLWYKKSAEIESDACVGAGAKEKTCDCDQSTRCPFGRVGSQPRCTINELRAYHEASQQRATPRTNAILLPINSHTLPNDVVYADEMRLLERELSAATDTIDLMRDEFQRIKGCCVEDADVASEIQGICDRAMLNIVQRVPVIKQRDNAERRLGVAMTALHRIQYIWQVGSEACADNSRAGELMAEKAREAIAQLSGAARQ
jgi:hypothetical protein